MPVTTVTKVIDGHDIEIVQFYAVRGFKIKTRLFKLVLPVLGQALGVADFSKTDLSKTSVDLERAVPKALMALAENLREDDFLQLMLDLLSSTFINKKMIDEKMFNEVFAANYTFAYKLAYEVIMVNRFFSFGDIGIDLSKILQTVSPEK
jgi:hypothetical protein